jgi:hypothetical protein
MFLEIREHARMCGNEVVPEDDPLMHMLGYVCTQCFISWDCRLVVLKGVVGHSKLESLVRSSLGGNRVHLTNYLNNREVDDPRHIPNRYQRKWVV